MSKKMWFDSVTYGYTREQKDNEETIYPAIKVRTIGELCSENCLFFCDERCDLFNARLRIAKALNEDGHNRRFRCKKCVNAKTQ